MIKTLYITYERDTKVIWAHGNRTIKSSRCAARRRCSGYTSSWGIPRIADSQLVTLKEDGSIHRWIKDELPYIDCQSSSFVRWPDLAWHRAGKMAKMGRSK